MKRAVLIAVVMVMVGCATLRDQVEDFCKRNPRECNEPVPSPSPAATPAPSPSPSPSPSPEASPSPSPVPSPSPTPVPTPVPCAVPSPSNTCARAHDASISEDPAVCWKCGEMRGWQVAHGNWIDHKRKDGWLEDNVGSGRYVTKDCDTVTWDGNVMHFREDGYLGNICPRMDAACPVASPEPCASPTPGAPTPGPTPGTCPQLVRWGCGIHAQMTPQFEVVPKEPVFSGNTIEFDSTARFGSGRGNACNSDHHAVCDAQGDDHGPNWRHCEDPRGPVWTVIDDCGSDKVKITNGGWGIQFVRVKGGTCRVKACPSPDVVDEEGQPVRVSGDACVEASVEVH